MRLLSFSFGTALLLVWALTYIVRAIALHYGVVAKRDLRRRHQNQIPLLGGTAFYVVLAGVTAVYYFAGALSTHFFVHFFSALTVIYVLGAWDDRAEIRPITKLTGQIIAAALAVKAMPQLPTVFRIESLPDYAVAVILVAWIVAVMNAVNFIDGLDGLCTGITGLSAITMAVISLAHGTNTNYTNVMLVSLAGACCGFLLHNFNPAKIFLGDSGSLLLGFVLAFFSADIEIKRSLFISLSIPFFLLSLPLFDMILAIGRRSVRRKSIFKGDHSHLHHRLMQVGLSHRQTVLCLWAVTAYLNLIAFTLVKLSAQSSIYIYALSAPVVMFLVMVLRFIEDRTSQQISSYSHLFLDEWQRYFSDRRRLISEVADGKHLLLFMVDYEMVLHDIAQREPARVIEFFMDFYKSINGGLRRGDYITRISDYRVVAAIAVPENLSTRNRAKIESRIKARIRSAQAIHKVFVSDKTEPEGLTVYLCPQDQEKILGLLDVSGLVNKERRKAA